FEVGDVYRHPMYVNSICRSFYRMPVSSSLITSQLQFCKEHQEVRSTTLASEGYAEESPTWKIGDDIWKGIEPFKFDSVTTCLSKPWDTESGFHHDLLQFNDPFHVVQEQHDQTVVIWEGECADVQTTNHQFSANGRAVHFNQPEKIEMKSLPLLASSSDKVVNHSPEHTQYNGQTPGSNRFIEQFTSAPAATNEYQNCELTSSDGQDNDF
ncbi:hypothetical protein PGTUg99_025126, partial [Puccinia graminis f. sp. tritici]